MRFNLEDRKLQQEMDWDLHQALDPWFKKYQTKVSWPRLITALHEVVGTELRGCLREESKPKNKKHRKERS